MRHLLCLIIYAICIHTISAQNCSAINSIIQVTEPSIKKRTILSAQALWPPYSYYITPTELVKLSNTENICSGSLSTDLTNKIVLIMPANGNCSYVVRAFLAQEKGAKAVLLGNDEKSSGDVQEISNDNTNLKTSIPTRMIPYNSAQYLIQDIDNGHNVKIEFGCREETNISSVLCFIDLSGDHWWMDGDYQLQIDVIENDHAVWMKNGYLLVLDEDLLIFLHDSAGADSWYWVITEDTNMKDDDKIVAKCSVGGIDSPMNCPSWFTVESEDVRTFTLNENIKINDTLCEKTDNYICIQSSQSQLAGLHGTYRQFNAKAPYWFREWVDCDTQPGYLTFTNRGESGVFWLIDPFDYWVIAECIITGHSPKEYDEYFAFHPEKCTQWHTLVDGSLDAKHKIYDTGMSITTDKCWVYQCDDDVRVPSKMCMLRNNIMHSFLEGEYQLSGVRGNTWNTSEWIRTNKLYYQGEYVPVYVWYYGEISTLLNWWVVAMDNLTTAMRNNGSSVYGYCPSDTISPTHCKSCWNFYFSGDDRLEGAWHADCTFDMIPTLNDGSDTTCGVIDDKFSDKTIDWPEYLCISEALLITHNGTYVYTGTVDFTVLMGGYHISDYTNNNIPMWVKPANDYTNNKTYIYYDKFYGYWQVGHDTDMESATLFCMEEQDDYLPTDCVEWYDTQQNILGNLFLYSNGCSDDDILSKNKTSKDSSNTNIIIVVLIVLGLIACFIAGFFYYKSQTKNKAGFERTTRGGMGDSREIELGDDIDQMDQVNLKNTNTKGGFDMSPLNVEGDDDDDLTIDAQQHDVVDDGDGDDEEHLIIGNHTNNIDDDHNESDPDLRMPDTDDEDDDDENQIDIMDDEEPEIDNDKQTLK